MENINELRNKFLEAGNEALLRTKDVAAFTGYSISWLNNMAVTGGGIPYVKIRNTRLYKKQDVLNWIEANGQFVTSTSEYRGGK